MSWDDTTKDFREKLNDDVGLDLIHIPAGEFWMGTPAGEEKSEDIERPQHFVKVPQFFLGKYPITQGQYQAVIGENPSKFQDDFRETGDALQRPVERVSGKDAQTFCEKLRERTGKLYRLPTEAEWEYACRAVIPTEKGADLTQEKWQEKYHQPFHFGETIATDLANYHGNYAYGRGETGEYRGQTTPVGYFEVANKFGLYDMHGNVWEWCEDDWQDDYTDASPQGEIARSNRSTTKQILRGGSWLSNPGDCRSACRYRTFSILKNYHFGFRVAVSPP